MQSFGDRLVEAVRQKKTPAIVGIDPRPELLPGALAQRHGLAAGAAPSVWARAIDEFCSRALDVVAAHVPAVKFQSAYFEMVGAPGIHVLHTLLRKARRLGLVTLLDAKRGDIGSTSEAYAESVFGFRSGDRSGKHASNPIADAITVNPYMGRDGIEPFLQFTRTPTKVSLSWYERATRGRATCNS